MVVTGKIQNRITPRRVFIATLSTGVLAGCGKLDQLQYQPATTPSQWCEQRPCFDVGSTVVSEPLGSFLVFALALLWIAVGVWFVIKRQGQKSRVWFGLALILGGVGAGLAGISYQLLSYPLKCAGWEYCRLTNGFEVSYSMTQAVSVSFMLIAVALACTRGVMKVLLVSIAVLSAVTYLVVSIIGINAPSEDLLSFAVLMLFAVPGIVAVFIIGLVRYRMDHQPMDKAIVLAAVYLVIVQVAYFAYYAAGVTQTLWNDGEGFYFSENDVLHVGMILWLIYVWRSLGPTLRDRPEKPHMEASSRK